MFRQSLRLISLVAVWAILPLTASNAQKLPPPPDIQPVNALLGNWLVANSDGALVPVLRKEHQHYNAVHQWVRIYPQQPFIVSFTAQAGTSIFLNNRLLFRANLPLSYTLDLSEADFLKPGIAQTALLTVWHPSGLPDYLSFSGDQVSISTQKPDTALAKLPKTKTHNSTYLLLLMALGLVYGFLRYNYPSDWVAIFRTVSFSRQPSDDTFYKKPILSVSGLLFLAAFALSLSLVTVAVKRSLHETIVLKQAFEESQLGILASILTGTAVVLVAVVGKYLYLQVMSAIFGFQQLIPIQYREFVRYSLLFGLFLPLLLLVYLAFGHTDKPQLVTAANMLLAMLLVVPAVRIFYLITAKYKVKSIQLICYLCTTEVIPLAIILKIIFLNY